MVLFIWAIAIFAIGNADDNHGKIIIGKITIILVLYDSIALLGILFTGFIFLHTNQQIGEMLEEGELKKMKTNYLFLLICSVCRVVISFIRAFVPYLQIRLDEDCYKQPTA